MRPLVHTSETVPIRVDFVSQLDTGLPGRIGLVMAPGKKDREGGWHRDLRVDLLRLRHHYRVDRLVSLMEAHEYRRLHITHLPARARDAGIALTRFAIRDVSAPLATAMPRFLRLIDLLLEDVRAGRTIAVHCRGGLGRSGLVAASCLVALGYHPAVAIRGVRAARPGALEITCQEQWVERVAVALEERTAAALLRDPDGLRRIG